MNILTVESITGTWVITNNPENKIVFTKDEAVSYENDKVTNKGSYKIGSELILKITLPYINGEKHTQDVIKKFEDDEMTITGEHKDFKVKRWLAADLTGLNTAAGDPIKNSIIGTWVDIDAADDSEKLVYNEDTLTMSVDAQKVEASMNFNNIPLSYKILAAEQILELTGENGITYLKVKNFAGDDMTLSDNDQEVKLNRAANNTANKTFADNLVGDWSNETEILSFTTSQVEFRNIGDDEPYRISSYQFVTEDTVEINDDDSLLKVKISFEDNGNALNWDLGFAAFKYKKHGS